MAAAFLIIGLVLIASGAIAGGDEGAMELPHLELPAGTPLDSVPAHVSELLGLPVSGTTDSGRGHGSDVLLELSGTADLDCAYGPGAPPPPPQGLMDIMSTSGCGLFAALVAATPNASDIFQERVVAGGGGLTLFFPYDKAVVAFEPTFRALPDDDRLAVLLHHATAARYGRAQLAAFDWVAMLTLAANRTQSITVRDDGDTVWLWTSCQCGAVRVIKTVVSSEESPLAVYIVDAVLLPAHLPQKQLDGGDEAAASGGYLYLPWLHCSIPLWAALSWVLAVVVGYPLGAWVASCRFQDQPMQY